MITESALIVYGASYNPLRSLIPSFFFLYVKVYKKILCENDCSYFSYIALLHISRNAFFINFSPACDCGLDFYVCCLVSGIFIGVSLAPGMSIIAIVIPGQEADSLGISVLAAQVLGTIDLLSPGLSWQILF